MAERYCVDVCVIGSGFAGSLISMMLARQGRSVALIENGTHPRFAIGESSTPLGNFKLRHIAERYNLPEVEPLCRYGDWLDRYPHVMRGPKRGFAYFYHQANKPFETTRDHRSELLVTANRSLQAADLHWLRSDVDAFLVDQAIQCGVIYLDKTVVNIDHERITDHSSLSRTDVLRGTRQHRSISIETRFTVVASGNPQLWTDSLPSPSQGRLTRTHSRSLFAHFKDVKPWSDVMNELGYSTLEHPFVCDQSALHHVFDGGWMWQLRFDDETTSVGFMLDTNRFPLEPEVSAQAEWDALVLRYPAIARQFESAEVVRPTGGIQRTDRLQQPLRKLVGRRWALLPAAAGFSDPLYSTGIAHSLFAVDRLARTLEELDKVSSHDESLAAYEAVTIKEIDLIDRLVSLAYRSSDRFGDYSLATMPYFAAATTCEKQASDGRFDGTPPAFLLADDAAFLDSLDKVEQCLAKSGGTEHLCEDHIRRALQPFNHVGLFQPLKPRMYWYTAAPKELK